MGKLLHFEAARRPIPAHNRELGPARILLFTGVRYERGGKNKDGAAHHQPDPTGGDGAPVSGLRSRRRG